MKIMLAFGLLMLICSPPSSTEATIPVTRSNIASVVDATGRKVDIIMPIERVVTINTSAAIILRALGVDIEKNIVGVTSYVTENPRFWPSLKDKPAFKFTNINYENLAELNAQLIILYRNSRSHTNEEKLKALNIQWLYLDCNDPRYLEQEIKLLGMLFGKEKEALELIQWIKRYDCKISERSIRIQEAQRPRIFYYLFAHTNLPKGIYNTINETNALNFVIEKAGGINITAGVAKDHLHLSPEWLLEQNPDAIIADTIGRTITGYNVDEPVALENMRKMTAGILNDKTLKNTSAAKNSRIMLIAQDLKQGPAYVIALASFARFLHPGIFDDINPADIAKEYHEKWCRLPHQGVYVYPEHSFNKEDAGDSYPQKSGSGSTVSVIDSAGRKIELSVPVGTIACLHTSGCRQLSLLGLDDRVVGVTAYISDDPGLYPRLKDKPDIGSVYAPNYEIILENQPDILIMGSAPVNLAPAVNKLEPAGIKVLALDLQPREGADAFQREKNYDHQLMLLATITGTENRAREFITWKQDIFEMIRRRTHDVEKVRVLCVNSVSKVLQGNGISAWAGERIIELAGGINPAAGLEGKEISAEWILEQDPDVVTVVGYWPGEGLGYGITGTDRVEKTFGRICANKVFHKTRAVKDNHLYLVAYYGLASGGQTPIGALYLAKRLYPERFADLDPEIYHREFLEKWFDVAYQGIWFYP